MSWWGYTMGQRQHRKRLGTRVIFPGHVHCDLCLPTWSYQTLTVSSPNYDSTWRSSHPHSSVLWGRDTSHLNHDRVSGSKHWDWWCFCFCCSQKQSIERAVTLSQREPDTNVCHWGWCGDPGRLRAESEGHSAPQL